MSENFKEIKEKLVGIDLNTKLQLLGLAFQMERRKTLDKQFESEMLSVEKKFNDRCMPYIANVNAIITGVRPPTDEELLRLPEVLNEQESINKEIYIANGDPLVGYWLTALKNSKSLQKEITKKDEQILQYLKTIECESMAENNNFGLIFKFEDNEYFGSNEVKVNFTVNEQQEPLKVQSTGLNWKDGKDITKKIVKKKKNKKVKTKEVEQESIFNIFRNIDIETEEYKKLPEDEQEVIKIKLENSFDISKLIYNEIVPYSLEYYLDVHVEEENEFEDDDDEDIEEDDDEDEQLSKEEAIKRMKARFGPKKK